MSASRWMFRVWDAEDKKMITFDIYGTDTGFHMGAMKSIDEMKLMQSTGLVDVNFKEVYEGDILKKGDKLGDVWFNTFSGHLCVNDDYGLDVELSDCRFCEVVGNIYENRTMLDELAVKE
jgi:hypothetical protein